MEIQWFTRANIGLATISKSNITLNAVAANHFKTAYRTLIGYDNENDVLIIKAIKKEDLVNGLYSVNETHPISIKSSYGRISRKNIIYKLTKKYPLDFSKKDNYQFPCEWNQTEKLLRVFLKKEVLQ